MNTLKNNTSPTSPTFDPKKLDVDIAHLSSEYKEWTWDSNETWDHLTKIFDGLFEGTSLKYIIKEGWDDDQIQSHPTGVEVYEIPLEGSHLLPWGIIFPGSTLRMGNGEIQWTHRKTGEVKTHFFYRAFDSASSTPPTNGWGDTDTLGLGTQMHTLWKWDNTLSERDIIMTLESLFKNTPLSFKILHPRSGCGGMISYGPPDRIVIYHTQTFEMLDVHPGECLWVDPKRIVLLSEKMEVGTISFIPEEKLDPEPDEWASYIEEMEKKDTILRNNAAPHKGCARDGGSREGYYGCDEYEDRSDNENNRRYNA